MDYGLIAVIGLWAIILFSVILHFFAGYKRGTKKSLYYFAVNLVTIISALAIFSLVSVSLFFTPQSFLTLIQGFGVNTSAFEDVILDPQISPLVFSIIDIVLKLSLFFILYPIIKWLLTMLLFKPIYSLATMRSDKKVKPQFRSKLFGGFLGSVKGFISTIVFLLPIIVIVGLLDPAIETMTNYEPSNSTTSLSTDTNNLNTNNDDDFLAPIKPYLNDIKTFNQFGPFGVIKHLSLGENSIIEDLFDMVFYISIETPDEEIITVSLSDEIKGIGEVFSTAYVNGYINPNYDYNQISKEDLPNIEVLFNYLENSRLLSGIIPIGLNYAINNYSEEIFELDITQRQYSMLAINEFLKVRWHGEDGEFRQLFEVVEAVLEFGSVGEWMELVDTNDFNDITLTEADVTRLASIVREIGDLNLLMLANVGIDYMTSMSDFQDQFTYIDEIDREEYLQNQLIYILGNPNYFLANHFNVLAEAIELTFSDENVNVFELIDNITDPNYILTETYASHIARIINKLTEFDLLLDTIPFVVDYGLFGLLELDRDNPEFNVIEDLVSDVNWPSEIRGISEIYEEVAKLGLAPFISNNVNYGLIVDHLAENHMGSIRVILNKVLTAEPIEKLLQEASPMLVDTFFNPTNEQEEAIKDFLLNDLLRTDENGIVNFKVGQEVSDLLTIIEGLYQVTNFEDANHFAERIMNLFIGQPDAETVQLIYEDIIQMFVNLDKFNRMSGSDLTYEQFSEALRGLQLLEIGQDFVIEFIAENYSDSLYITDTNVTDLSVGDEIANLVDLLKDFGSYHSMVMPESYTKIDLARFIDNELRQYFLDSSVFVKSNIAFHIENLYHSNETVNEYMAIPYLGNKEGLAWQNEIDALFTIIFDLNHGLFVDSSKGISTILNYSYIRRMINNYEQIELDEFFRFGDETLAISTFSSIGNSKIVSQSIMNLVEDFEYEGIKLSWPQTLRSGLSEINGNELAILISDLVGFVDDYNDQSLQFNTIGDIMDTNFNSIDYLSLVDAFYSLELQSVNRLANNNVLNEITNQLLLNEDVHNLVYDLINSSVSDLEITEGLFEDLVLPGQEFGDLLRIVHDLKVPTTLLSSNQSVMTDSLVSYLTNTLTEQQLEDVLTYPIFHQLFTRVLSHPEVGNYIINLVEPMIESALPSQLNGLELDIQSYLDLLNGFTRPYFYDNQTLTLFDMSEFTTLFRTYKIFDLNEANDINKIDFSYLTKFKVEYSGNYNSNLEVLTESRLVRALIAHTILDDSIREFGANYLNDLLASYNVDFSVTSIDLLLGSPFIEPSNGKYVFSQNVIIETLETMIAVDIDGITKGRLTPYDAITRLNDNAFQYARDDRTALDVIYDLTFVQYGIDFIVENESVSSAVIDMANTQLERLVSAINSSLVVNHPLTIEDVTITSDMVDQSNLITIVEAVKSFDRTGINNLVNHRSLFEVYDTLNLTTSKQPLVDILQTPLFKTPITRVVDHELWSDLVSQFANIFISNYSSTVSLSNEVFKLDYNSSDELIVDLVDLIGSLYATGYDIGVSLNPQFIRNLETQTVTYSGNTDTRLNQFFNSNIIVNYLDKVLRHEEIIGQAVDVINNQMHQYLTQYNIDLDFEITVDMVVPSEYALLDGKLNPEEYKTVIRAFNRLNLNSFGELSNFTQVNYLHDKVTNTQFVNTLFESKWLHHGLSDVAKNTSLFNSLASFINSEANKQFGVNVNVDPLGFDFTDPRYELFYTTGEQAGLVSIEVIKDTLSLGTSVNWLNVISMSQNHLMDNLLLPNQLGDDHITQISENKIVIALFDRFLNPNNNEHNFSNVYSEVLNALLDRYNLGTLSVGNLNNFFSYGSDLLDENNVLDSYEIVRAVNGLSLVDLSNPTQFRIDRISKLINDDQNDNMVDDFEELFASKLLNHYMVIVARNEKVYDKVAEVIERRIGNNITIPVADIMFPEQLIVNDKISIEELKSLVSAGAIIEENTSGFANLSPDVLMNVVDQNIENGEDDLDRILKSEYIVYVIGNVLNNPGINRLANRLINRVTGIESNIDITVPNYLITDNNHADLTHGRLSRPDIRQLVVAANLLLDGQSISSDIVSLSLVLNAIDRDSNANGIDDFDEINDGYLHYLLATLFDSDGVKKLISDGSGIDPTELVFSNAMYDVNNVMSKSEIKQIFLGLQELGITDFDDMSSGLGEDMLNTLGQEQIDVLLASSYLYRVIDLTIKQQITVPVDALNTTGDYINYVSKDEISKLVEALGVVGGSLDLDVSTFGVSDLVELYDLDSVIIDSFISRELLDRYPEPLDPNAYRNVEQTQLTREELGYMMTTLEVLIGEDGLLTDLDSLDLDLVTTDDLDAIISLESYLVTRILTNEITNNVLDINEIPDDSFTDSTKLDFKQSELEAIVGAINILGGEISKLESLDSSDITSSKLNSLLLLESPLIEYQISETVKEALGPDGIPHTALDSDGNVLRDELDKLVIAISHLGDDLDQMSNLTPSDVNELLLLNLLDTDSRIVDYQISEVIIDSMDEDSIPDSAYDTDGNISRTELYNIQKVLVILGTVEDINNLEPDTVLVSTLRSLLNTESEIVERQISDAVVSSIGEDEIPESALDSEGHVLRDELFRLVDAMEALVNTVGELSTLSASHITADTLEEALSKDSIIVENKISEAVKTTFASPDDVPVDAIDLLTGDISREELDNLVEALRILNSPASELETLNASEINADLLEDLLATNSLVVERHLAVTVDNVMPGLPEAAYDEDGFVKRQELDSLIEAMRSLGGSVDAMDTIDAETINNTLLTDLLLLDSRIIDYQMSKAIKESLGVSNIPNDALDGENNITRDELVKLNEAIGILGGTLDGVKDIDANTMEPNILEQLTDLESSIIDRQLSDTLIVVLSSSIPDHVKDAQGHIIREELQKLSIAVNSLGLASIGDMNTVDENNINGTMIMGVVNSESGIALKIVSDAIIAASIDNPDSYETSGPRTGEIKQAEMESIATVLEVAGGTISNINTINFSNLATATDDQIDEIFNDDSTIVYYMISDELTSNPIIKATFADSDFVDGDRDNRLTREAIRTRLKS